MKCDVVVVGAGISGAVLAERFASVLNKKVLVIEQRDHIGGNCYDYTNLAGIRVSKYGAHLFHTNYEDVWTYVNRFSDWYPYVHRVVAHVDGKLVPVPVNIRTVNALFGTAHKIEDDMAAWLKANVSPIVEPKNGEEAALRRVGPVLFEKIFKNYTKKQWDLWPHELDASVLDRIPVRLGHDDRYFSDKYQALPKDGYTPMFEKILAHPNITVMLNTSYESVKDTFGEYEHLFFTGPIDQFFNYKFDEKLQYRSIRFEFETYDQEKYQDHAVINYPNEHDFTRIVEYKHFTGQKHSKTTISKEYATWEGEPYYPVPNERNRELYLRYQEEANKLEPKGVYFVGRLANYKYFNMDQAFKNALDLFARLSGRAVI